MQGFLSGKRCVPKKKTLTSDPRNGEFFVVTRSKLDFD